MRDILRYYLSFPLVSCLVLLLPLTLWLEAIMLKGFGSAFLFNFISRPVGINNIENISLYVLTANLIINFITILRLNMKTVNPGEAESIRKVSLIHTGSMFFAACYTLIIYLAYEFEKFGNIPVGRG